ncbi:C40 family peptidase [Clostridium magnum]|uniref:Gamma-D-glutamyl-L-lysine endopeptidase n=1 Tax=Clostridium magnum DSM 2767 TaxID=1121326 RepID=A0A161XDA1_9CLOT|nr:SH3 domain-containing C40 family peptidase [Clostridium magnum]KZL92316.1 gamma-D-glutamyl-L-lysine endopeptidase [Clostridium magnum DSM 2767]SHH13619.1 Cell wall-associated hydrolase, NlpC family [Clostridium magnum DSM 2767]
MNWYKDYRLVKNDDGYTVIIYLDPETPEFAKELMTDLKENLLSFDDEIRKFMSENFANTKINSIKLMLGAAIVGTIPFMAHAQVQASGLTSNTAQQTTTQAGGFITLNTTGKVTASNLNVRKGPSTSYSIIHKLWQRNVVKVIGQSGNWYKIRLSDGRVGWVSKTYLQLPTPTATRTQKINSLISTAKSLLGTPYVWGGESLKEGGFDCSGFTQYVFKSVGYNLSRISADQAKQGTWVSRNSLQPGDLVFFSLAGDGRISHVGLYIGGMKMIHSPKAGDVVKVTDISTYFWHNNYMTARRIIR